MTIDDLSINTIRVLACEMIEKAKSGHPGIVLGASPLLYTLYKDVLNIDPNNPTSMLRDRFVLSAGHGSAMLYSALHLFGYDITMQDLKEFRQLDSKTPGHPEADAKLGIESTTGPLGQGVANAVGMAIAERHLAQTFNKPDATLIDNYTYVLAGDGCLMEGVANEALSLAGTLKLNKLIVFYDYNKITIDGTTDNTFNQNTEAVFKGYGFNVIKVKDANSTLSIKKAVKKAKNSDKPTLIILKSIIGYGSAVAGSEKAHGSPLGEKGLSQLKSTLGVDTQSFDVLPSVTEHFNTIKQRYNNVSKLWQQSIDNYKAKYANDYKLFNKYIKQDFTSVQSYLKKLKYDKASDATRNMSGAVLDVITQKYPYIIGGAADLVASTKASVKSSGKFAYNAYYNRNIMYGIREFAMGAISNGISLYGGLTPFASTFFVFSDYMRSSIRMSALMNQRVLYILTHDSIGLGEDGPTHQAVEHLNSFRVMPNVNVCRPSNFTEVKASYDIALNSHCPTIMVLSRQSVNNAHSEYEDALKGGYVIDKEQGKLDIILLATGSEVDIALEAKKKLQDKGYGTRVVSMPSLEVYDKQTSAYKEKVLPKSVKAKISIEAGSTGLWYKYVGQDGYALGVDDYGKSGKYKQVYKHFGLTCDNVYKEALKVYKKNNK